MQTVKVHSLTIFSADRYEYDRQSTIKLSEEHFSDTTVQTIIANAISEALFSGAKFEYTTDVKEIPVDEEESAKVKLEKAKKENSAHWSERSKLQKKVDELEAQVATLKSVCPADHIDKDEEQARADQDDD